jgi:hypothetical protein
VSKLIQIVIIAFILTFEARSQKLMFEFQSGLGTYSMAGLKNLNEGVTQKIPFETKQLTNFKANLYYRPSVLIKFEDLNLGLIYTYQSASSGVTGNDNTGEYRNDMVANAHCPGLFGEVTILYVDNFSFSGDASAGLVFSDLQINEYFNQYDSLITNATSTYKALNYYLEPGLSIKYSFKHFYFGFSAGYFITIGKQAFYTENDKYNKLYDSYNDTNVKPEWNGFRVGLSVSYFIYRKSLIKPNYKSKRRR